MRFFWKATPDSADHTGVKCKIMRPVSFTDTLDVFPYCNAELQAAIKANRDRLGEKVDIKKTEDEPEAKKAKSSEAMDVEEPDEDLAAALALSMEDDSAVKHRELLESCGLDKDFQGSGLCGNQPVRRVLAPSSGGEPAPPRHRADIMKMAWRTTRRFGTNAP